MQKHLWLYTLTLLLVASAGQAQAPRTNSAGVALYVATTGDDAWSGALSEATPSRSDGPFATIARAQSAVRQLRSTSTVPVTVFIRGGVYQLADTLVFTPSDSGTANAPIIYSNFADETVVISGGRAITGWQKSNGNIWTAKVPDVAAGKWVFRQLFANGQRRTRARTPNSGFLLTAGYLPGITNPNDELDNPMTKIGFRYRDGDLKNWNNLDDVNLVLADVWFTSIHFIASLSAGDHTVQFTAPRSFAIGYVEPQLRYKRYYVENFLEALDSPGEWYLDRHTGLLSYWPMPGEDLARATIIAPHLRHLVQFSGGPAQPVEYVTLHGLSFQYADWFLAHDADLEGGYGPSSGAVEAVGTSHVTIDGCEVAHVGENALFIAGASDTRLTQSELHDLGAGGVYLANWYDSSVGNVVDNCFIHDGGKVATSAYGLLLYRGSQQTISHNEITGFDNIGIHVSIAPVVAQSVPHDNTIEFNHVHDVGRAALSDLAGIYIGGGDSPGTKVRNNLVHHVYTYTYGAGGIYTDEGASNITIEDNVVHDVGTGYQHNFGTGNVVRNNVFTSLREAVTSVSRELPNSSFTFENNVVVIDDGQMLDPGSVGAKYQFDRNLYWVPTGRPLRVSGLTFDEWKGRGQDVHSSVADPLFSESGELTLQPQSPAYGLGIHKVDVSAAGLYGDRAWTSLPKRRLLEPSKILLVATPGRHVDDEDYEDVAVGDFPGYAMVSGEESGASVRVTDEASAGGGRSLKFSSVTGVPPYSLSAAYSPYLINGTAYMQFDLRIDTGSAALLWAETSTVAKPMNGPNIYVQTDGSLIANGKNLMSLPARQWVHFNLSCPLGVGTASYSLTVTVAGQNAHRFDAIPFDSPRFSRLTFMAFFAASDQKNAFFIDNVHWGLVSGRRRTAAK